MPRSEISLKPSTKIMLSLYKRDTLISIIFYAHSLAFSILLYIYWPFFLAHQITFSITILLTLLFLLFGYSLPPKRWLRGKLPERISRDLLKYVSIEGGVPTRSQLIRQIHIDRKLARDVESILRIDYDIEEELTQLNQATEAILKLANEFGGILSLSKTFLEMDLPLNDLKRALRHLQRQGITEQIEENIYDFHGMREFNQDDKKLIKFAEKRGGEVNIEEILKDFSWSRKKIELKLRELEQKGIALKKVKLGTIKWYFPGLIHKKGKVPEEKQKSSEKSSLRFMVRKYHKVSCEP